MVAETGEPGPEAIGLPDFDDLSRIVYNAKSVNCSRQRSQTIRRGKFVADSKSPQPCVGVIGETVRRVPARRPG